MRGARVCTRDGREARILCFDSGGVGYYETPLPILADVKCEDAIFVFGYQENGLTDEKSNRINDLMMADDDYLEKLERGEYGNATIEAPVWQEPHRIMTPEDTAKVTFLSPFDESYWRKQYAGMAMQGLCAANGTMKPASMVADVAVEYADALIEELKKEKE